MTPSALTLLPPMPLRRGNPLAPQWMLPSFALPNCETEFTYQKTFTITAGAELTNQVIPISADSPILIRCIDFWQNTAGADDTGLQVRFRDGQGKRMSMEYCNYLDLAGPMVPPQPMAAGSQFGIDFNSLSGSDITVTVELRGIKRGPTVTVDPALALLDQPFTPLWQLYSQPVPGEYDRSFDYYFEFAITASQRISTILQMDDDADFYWRSFCGSISGSAQVALRFFDQSENALSTGNITDLNYFDTNQGKPMYPELYCPYGAVLSLTGSELAAQAGTLKLNLKGVKRYRR